MNHLSSRRPFLQSIRLFVLAVCAGLALAEPLSAQKIIRAPSSAAATAYSAGILAQSDYLRAQGDFLVSASTARQINAQAAEQEMRNSVQWVNTYFERRRLNREYRAAEKPGYLEREDIRNRTYYRLIKQNVQTVLAADVTNELNWMLHDLLAYSSFQSFLESYADSLVNSTDNIPLSDSEKHHVRLREGRNAGGKVLVFRADTAEMLETRWPLGLRAEAFDASRAQFEAARRRALTELKEHKKLDRANEAGLMKAVDQLSETLNAAYPRERQASSPQIFTDYLTAKRYLQSLALATYRLIESGSEVAFDDSYRFQGDTLADLLQHMMTKGLEFASPEPGDESTYRHLFGAVRALYLKAVPEPISSR
jgi:hypothetical protein